MQVFCGNDDVHDTWSPCGTADMLERAAIIGWRIDWRTDPLLDALFGMVSGDGARALGIAEHGIAVGKHANLSTLPAETIAEAAGAVRGTRGRARRRLRRLTSTARSPSRSCPAPARSP